MEPMEDDALDFSRLAIQQQAVQEMEEEDQEPSSSPSVDPTEHSLGDLLTLGSSSTNSVPITSPSFTVHGRRYANASYFQPNDQDEVTRLSILHQAYLLLLGKAPTMHRVPSTVRRILDIGTGPGDWALTMADQNRSAQIFATDLTANSFVEGNAPATVAFQIDDARVTPWTYAEPFDFIHMRGLGGAFTAQEWQSVLQQAYLNLMDGCVLEISDFDGRIILEQEPSDSHLGIYNGALQSAADHKGLVGVLGFDHLKRDVIEGAGFTIQKSQVIEVPLGDWSEDQRKRRVGRMAMVAVLEGLEARSLRLMTEELEWSGPDVKDLCEKVKMEIVSPGARPKALCHFVLARRLMQTS